MGARIQRARALHGVHTPGARVDTRSNKDSPPVRSGHWLPRANVLGRYPGQRPIFRLYL